MLSQYLKLFRRKRSRYISWNILFLWGFGLWMALCTSNMYDSDILVQKATLFYQQNWSSEIAYNIATRTKTMENVLHITARNCTLCKTMLTVKAMLKHIYALVFVCCMILIICIREHIRKCIKIWNNIIHNAYSTGMYLKAIASNYTDYVFDRMIINKSNHCTFQSELTAKYEIKSEHLQRKFNYEGEEKNSGLKENIEQSEMIFSNYTILLFSNYELYCYFYNQQLKYTFNLLTKYSGVEDSEYTKNDLVSFDNYRKNSKFGLNKMPIQKRIISSSPEFQKFLANSRKFLFFYPYMLEMSTSYIVRIKSTYT